MRSGATVGDVAMRIHSGLAKEMKYAYITGPSAKFKNQKVGKEHILMDGDIVTLNLK
jgi:ribosome-interacting GTPase 1